MQSVLEANDLTELMQMVRLHFLWCTAVSSMQPSLQRVSPGVRGKVKSASQAHCSQSYCLYVER